MDSTNTIYLGQMRTLLVFVAEPREKTGRGNLKEVYVPIENSAGISCCSFQIPESWVNDEKYVKKCLMRHLYKNGFGYGTYLVRSTYKMKRLFQGFVSDDDIFDGGRD